MLFSLGTIPIRRHSRYLTFCPPWALRTPPVGYRISTATGPGHVQSQETDIAYFIFLSLIRNFDFETSEISTEISEDKQKFLADFPRPPLSLRRIFSRRSTDLLFPLRQRSVSPACYECSVTSFLELFQRNFQR